ncbi:adenylate kinase family protein [Mucilaginibacter gotjawali]|uniref:Broad-specificity NMP kinase n=1 Tax=Mucilaginibacter gotjawali TaxID=1550579 RepID=A0A839S902_9SPHI|nr:hypothetical protein [Mucilaginibacter gotjawali]MBB3054296.1 broad-specificity NMP kinase [Mucilaginibacter gotjawali]
MIMLNADIFLVRGAPGVGKSTLTAGLKKLFPRGVTIEVGPFLKMINAFQDGDKKQYSDSLELISDLALRYLEKDYRPVFIVGPLKALRVQHLRERLPAEVNFKLISLYAGNEDIDRRIDGRVIGFKDKNVAHVVNSDIMDRILPDDIRFDTTNKNADQVFQEIKEYLTAKFSR